MIKNRYSRCSLYSQSQQLIQAICLLVFLYIFSGWSLAQTHLRPIQGKTIEQRLDSPLPAIVSGVGSRMNTLLKNNIPQLQQELSYMTFVKLFKKKNWPGIKKLVDILEVTNPSPQLAKLQKHCMKQLLQLASNKKRLMEEHSGADNFFEGALLAFYGGQITLLHLGGFIALTGFSVVMFPISGVLVLLSPILFWKGAHKLIYTYYQHDLKGILQTQNMRISQSSLINFSGVSPTLDSLTLHFSIE